MIKIGYNVSYSIWPPLNETIHGWSNMHHYDILY